MRKVMMIDDKTLAAEWSDGIDDSKTTTTDPLHIKTLWKSNREWQITWLEVN